MVRETYLSTVLEINDVYIQLLTIDLKLTNLIINEFGEYVNVPQIVLETHCEPKVFIKINYNDKANDSYCDITNEELKSYCSFLLFDKKNKEFIIGTNQNETYFETAKNCFKIIRKILEVELSKNYIYLHSGFIIHNSYGIGLIGEKFTGKTTTILNMLMHLNPRFVSNDKVYLKIEKEDVEIFSLPYTVGVRKGTLIRYPKLLQKINEYNERNVLVDFIQDDEKNVDKSNSKIYISPKELNELFSVDIISSGSLNLFVEPYYNPNISFPRFFLSTLSLNDIIKEYRIIQNRNYLSVIIDVLCEDKFFQLNNDDTRGFEIPIIRMEYNEHIINKTMEQLPGLIEDVTGK